MSAFSLAELTVFVCRSCRLGRAGDPDRDGGGARHRQPDLHLDRDQPPAGRSSANGRGGSVSVWR